MVEVTNAKYYSSRTLTEDMSTTTGAVSGASFMSVLTSQLRRIRKSSNDVSSLFEILANDFYNTNEKFIFSQTGGGRFADLKESTKKSKGVKPYPILVRGGALKASLTSRHDINAICEIRPKSMVLGTKLFYAHYHQYGFNVKNTKVEPREPVDFNNYGRAEKWRGFTEKWAFDNVKH